MDGFASEKRDRMSHLVKQITGTDEMTQEALESAYEELSMLAEDLYETDLQLQKNYAELLNTQQQLDEERRRYQALFEFAPHAYLVTDVAGVIEKANHAAEKLLNVRHGYLIGKTLTLFLDRQNWKRFFNLFRNTSPRVDFEMTVLPRGKDPIIAAITLETIINALYEPVERRWLLRDITQQRQAESEITELYRRLQASSEVERLRLAQDLHDGPMQDLYGAVFQLELNNVGLQDPAIQDSIREVEESLKRVASELRSICGELRPPTLANLGVERAIRSHAERVQERHSDIKIKLTLDKENLAIPQDMRLSLFRIYQQAVTNVILHATASQVEVTLKFDDSTVKLSIEDNGSGFKKPGKWLNFVREGHYGLAGIAERAHAMGGELNVDTAPGQGTKLTIKVPVNRDASASQAA